jgi:hypothetical protein
MYYLYFNLFSTLFYFVSIHFYNKLYTKYIVISDSNNNILKIHSKPLSFDSANKYKNKLIANDRNKRLDGYSVKRTYLILKFKDYTPIFNCF